MPRRPSLQDRLENDRHEQFARCIAMGNDLMVCYVGCGYPPDEEAAKALARLDKVRLRAEEWFSRHKPHAWYKRGYTHPV